jgi:hypothetical protein
VSDPSQTRSPNEALLGSKLITTSGMAIIFVFVACFLVWSSRQLFLGRVDREPPQIFYISVVAVAIRGAFIFPERPVKFAFLLLAANYTLRIVVHYLHPDISAVYAVFVLGSIMKQFAFIIILLAIAKWFKSALQTESPDYKSDGAVPLP